MKHFHIESGTKYLVGNPFLNFLRRSISNPVCIHTKISSRTSDFEPFDDFQGMFKGWLFAFEVSLDLSQIVLQRKNGIGIILTWKTVCYWDIYQSKDKFSNEIKIWYRTHNKDEYWSFSNQQWSHFPFPWWDGSWVSEEIILDLETVKYDSERASSSMLHFPVRTSIYLYHE